VAGVRRDALVNRGNSPELAFKSGDCVSLLVAEDGMFDRNRLGEIRIVIAWLQGKPTTVVFRPTFNLDVSRQPHSKVRIRLALYTFGPWRGKQSPPHRLGFWDSQGTKPVGRYFTFATVAGRKQSWPDEENRKEHPAATGAQPDDRIDTSAEHRGDHRWPVVFEYVSDSDKIRFAILGGMHDFGPDPRISNPSFGIDNVRVEVFQD
jgi:hypothetical protein